MNTKVFRNLSYGLYIVSTWDMAQNRPTGCVANSIMQVTSSPATVAVSLNHDNYTNSRIRESGHLAVSILSQKSDPAIIGRFGFSSGRDTSKFEGVPYAMMGDAPVVDDSCGWFRGRVIDQMETATHTVFLVEVEDGEPKGDVPAMTYGYYHSVIKGKTAPNAPTYQPEAEAATGTVQPGGGPRWRCPVCGYEYQKQPPFETLPDSWVCPVCGLPKDKFVRAEAQA